MNERALIEFARASFGKPFTWGETDCAMLALRAIDAFRGTFDAGRFAGLWHDEASALAHFQIELPSMVLEAIGCQSIDPHLSAIGDVLLIPGPVFPECAHVVLGRLMLSSSPEEGVHYGSAQAGADRATYCFRPG